MTGLRSLLGRAMGRASVAVVTVAACALLAPAMPTALADPAGDADAAINAAYDAAGGPGGTLGPKDGGVYPVGAGFGQNFASGRIFFSPGTGAHVMQGAILDKYLSLGGPGDGDLGFPDIDEGAGRAPNSRNVTFSAADDPVIFWTPDTGAHVVRGAINAAWDQVGGSAGSLGVPTEDEVYRGNVVSQTFTGGQLSWDRSTKAFTTTPPELADQLGGVRIPGDATSEIDAARRAAGGPLGPLGAAQGPAEPVAGDGLVQTFDGGKIFYSPATGANVLTGQVLAKYESVGGPGGDLGFPKANEADGGLAPASRFAAFTAADEPVIFWTPDFGAVIVRGAMNAAWSTLGGATGTLGAPTADQTESDDVVTQKFANGAISWNRSTKAFSTEPPNLAADLAGVRVPGQDAPQATQGDGPQAAADGRPWYRQWWWLLVIVPVVLLVAAVGAAVVLHRRRADDRPPLDRFDDYGDYDDDQDFESGPVPAADAPAGTDQPPFVPLSAWAMPGEGSDGPAGVPAAGPAPAPGASAVPDIGPEANLDEDQDAIDTAPTRVVSEDAIPGNEVSGDAASPGEGSDRGPADRGVADEPATAAFDELFGGRSETGRHAGSDPTDGPLTPAVDREDEAADAYGLGDDFDDGFGDDVHDGDPARDEFDDPVFEDAFAAPVAGAAASAAADPEPSSGPPSGRHAAIQLDDTAPSQTSLRLAQGDPYTAPAGYPIKADTKTGLYWLPTSVQYDRVRAEIWFASEEFALTNGFVRG